jgi:hypothetical protein
MLVQDNDPAHKNRLVTQHSRERQHQLEEKFRSPSKSGDLNPIENVWSLILDRMEGKRVETENQLKDAITAALREVPISHTNHTIDSMPRGIRLILEKVEGSISNGHSIAPLYIFSFLTCVCAPMAASQMSSKASYLHHTIPQHPPITSKCNHLLS